MDQIVIFRRIRLYHGQKKLLDSTIQNDEQIQFFILMVLIGQIDKRHVV